MSNEPQKESVADLAREMATLVRAHHRGSPVEEMDVTKAFARMMLGEAKTPIDALALLVAARALSPHLALFVPPVEQSYSMHGALSVHCMVDCINKAIEALEAATGERGTKFSGHAQAMN